ncbi:tRNA (N6-isopentenyl adenosine(37)-C2)-methylthiotransferase MiaB [Murdochiella massiliensis]|uniref:tRNA (N6-isopentenyl adenosine(37)-C2)-methylthiotransferase MiaB n=1 Tax=Murdochiella massiliensis TaxID=1673723 RepID=UPI00082D8A63|nr:tRNA (N6-isopentenyl adenosine(37)-C2)-methylthiotransferase MiaB [Murdochiella massiliensis]
MKYKIITHGCQMNEHDSERMAYLLESMGYQATEDTNEADFIAMNTCLVRENAEQKVFGQIGALKKWKADRPGRMLALCGCMMQTGGAKDVILKSYPQVDLIFGTHNIGRLPQLIDQVQQTGERIVDISSDEEDRDALYVRNDSAFAYVNIMTGCNNFCSYCIVPYARGREISRPAEEVLNEVRALAARGYREIMLLGQNVNSYADCVMDFPVLLGEVAEVPGILRVRFMSSHPKDLSDRLIAVMAQHPTIERHFHLPLQSGSNKVLKEMNRHYTREHYMDLVTRLREAMPDIALSTDIIVGFPGETEEDHKQTLALCREVEFTTAFTFLYSPRPGTRAFERQDHVDEETKSRRFRELLDVLYPIFLRKNREAIGDTVQVLVESVSKTDATRLSGRDAQGRLIHFQGERSLIGKMIAIRIQEANSFALFGEQVE